MSPSETVNILLVDDQPAKLMSYEVILSELGENSSRRTRPTRRCSTYCDMRSPSC